MSGVCVCVCVCVCAGVNFFASLNTLTRLKSEPFVMLGTLGSDSLACVRFQLHRDYYGSHLPEISMTSPSLSPAQWSFNAV